MLYIVLIYLIILTLLPIENKRNMIIASVVPIILLTVFRYGIGADYFSYESIYLGLRDFSYIDSLKVYTDIELPFRSIMYLFTSIGVPYQIFNVIISVTIILVFTLWMSDNLYTAKSISYGALIFYSAFIFVWSWSALRQGIALAITIYFYYNKKHNFSTKTKIIATLIASMFHVSALVNLIILFSHKFTKRTLLFMLSVSLVITMIPLDILFSLISNLPLISKISEYLDPRFGFWNFAGLVRLSFFAVSYLCYDYFSEDEYGKNLINSFMFGFVIYFMLNAVPIAAGRINIYTFILIIIIIPIFLEAYNLNIYVNRAFKFATILFAVTFLFKEANTMEFQSGIQKSGTLVPYSNIFNIGKYEFKDYFHERRSYTNKKEYELSEFNKNVRLDQINDIGDHNKYKVAFSDEKGYYGVINQYGKVVHEFKYYRPMYIFENIMLQYHTQESVDLYSVFNLDNNEKIYFEDIKDEVDMSNNSKFQTIRIWDLDPSYLKEGVLDVFNYKDMLTDLRIIHLEIPEPYKIMKATYFHKEVFVFLNEDYELLINDYFYDYSLMDDQGFIQIDNDTTTEIFNNLGERIWMSKKKKDYFSLK